MNMNILKSLKTEDFNDGYYHFRKDAEDFPDAMLYIIWSKRGPGKTYSTLRYELAQEDKFIYLKRTAHDAELITSDFSKVVGSDFSPMSPLNEDFDMCIDSVVVDKKTGLGAFVERGEDDEINGTYGLIGALNVVKSYKGVNYRPYNTIILDEFIPQLGEISKKDEGEMLLNFQKTVERNRTKEGQPPVKMILLSNTDQISTSITNTLGIVNEMLELTYSKESRMYLKDRKILLHHIKPEECPATDDEHSGLYDVMKGTPWFLKSYEGLFAGADLSKVQKVDLKGYKPFCAFLHQGKMNYVYMNNQGNIYISYSRHNGREFYDLSVEADAKRFGFGPRLRIYDACVKDRARFEKYTMYDLIMNYKNFYKI